MTEREASRRSYLLGIASGAGALAGCSTLRDATGRAVRRVETPVDEGPAPAARLAAHLPAVGRDEFTGRELTASVRTDGASDGEQVIRARAQNVRYLVEHEPVDLDRVRLRKEFLGREPVDSAGGFEIYGGGDRLVGYAEDGRVEARPSSTTLSKRALLDRCIDVATGGTSLLDADADVRTLTERVRGTSRVRIHALDDEVYGDERMRVPGASMTAIADSVVDADSLRREVGGLFPTDSVDEAGFTEWVESAISPNVSSVPTVVREGRVMRAYWENPRERPATPTEQAAPTVRVWIEATAEGWRFSFPDEDVWDRGELVLPAGSRPLFEATSRIEIVEMTFPADDGREYRLDALPGTFTGFEFREPLPVGDLEIGCSGACQWTYAGEFGTTARVVPPAAYRSWLADPTAT